MFDPFFMFYGGTLYALAGALAAALGGSAADRLRRPSSSPRRRRGLRRHAVARAPARRPLVAGPRARGDVRRPSAYYVTNLYGRGAWPEFVAVVRDPAARRRRHVDRAGSRDRGRCPACCSSPPPSSWTRQPQHHARSGAALVIVVTARRCCAVALGRPLSARRGGSAAAALARVALAVCVNAWFLVPNVALRRRHADRRAGRTPLGCISATSTRRRRCSHPVRHVPASSTTAGPLRPGAGVAARLGDRRRSSCCGGRLTASAAAGRGWPARLVLGGLLALIMVEPLWRIAAEDAAAHPDPLPPELVRRAARRRARARSPCSRCRTAGRVARAA